ncbi:unnamed protein product [Arabidopsis halleri]
MSGALAWQVKKLILNKKKKILWVVERRSHGLFFSPGSSLLCVCLVSPSLLFFLYILYCSYILKNRS